MQVRYVGHACLSIEVAGRRLLTDPWWNGPAYTGQWHAYPRPRVQPGDMDHVDWIYISHGHEDHFHIPTLRTIDKRAGILIPKFADPALRDVVRSLGFARVVEIGHGQTRRLAPGLRATMYLNKEDSILVLQGDGRVLVNANDALHASSRHVIEHLCAQIRKRHPRIDALFMGYASGSWFPNCMQLTDAPAFDGELRERVLLESFAWAVRQLEPRLVVPIAAGFVLLEDHLRWIHALRYRLGGPREAMRQVGWGDTALHYLAPGDRIVSDQVRSSVDGLPDPEQVEREIRTLYAARYEEIQRRKDPEESRIDRILDNLRDNAERRARRVLRRGDTLVCRIDLRDAPEVSFLVEASAANGVHITRCDRLRMAPMVLTTRLDVLEAWALQDYGFESLTIGYGATLQLRERDLRYRNTLVELLGRKPMRLRGADKLALWLRYPLRSLDTWRRDLHWLRLAWRMRTGSVQRYNDLYALDPQRWSPVRDLPLPRRSA